jgi:hypothetical protein
MESTQATYPITILGQKLVLNFEVSDAPTKKGINLQFVMQNVPQDARDKEQLQNKLSIALQKRFGDAGIPIDYNERNPYINVISFIIPISSIADQMIKVLKGQ